MNTTLRLTASYSSYHGPDTVQGFSFASERFSTREQAESIAAVFPKSAKIRVTSVAEWAKDEPTETYMARTQNNLRADAVNGGVNETAIKRYWAIVRAADKAGVEIEYDAPYVHSYESREAFEVALV